MLSFRKLCPEQQRVAVMLVGKKAATEPCTFKRYLYSSGHPSYPRSYNTRENYLSFVTGSVPALAQPNPTPSLRRRESRISLSTMKCHNLSTYHDIFPMLPLASVPPFPPKRFGSQIAAFPHIFSLHRNLDGNNYGTIF
jgi:hypothetical protein